MKGNVWNQESIKVPPNQIGGGGFPGKFHRVVRTGHLGEGGRGVRAFPATVDGTEVTENEMWLPASFIPSTDVCWGFSCTPQPSRSWRNDPDADTLTIHKSITRAEAPSCRHLWATKLLPMWATLGIAPPGGAAGIICLQWFEQKNKNVLV